MNNEYPLDVTSTMPAKVHGSYKADFLWPNEEGSVQEAAYEFANAGTRAYQEFWWNKLLERSKK